MKEVRFAFDWRPSDFPMCLELRGNLSDNGDYSS